MPAAQLATVMRALADPTRRAVYEQIVCTGEITVGELARDRGVSQSAISQHLRSLREAGLIRERRAGRHAHYRALPGGLEPLVDWLDVYAAFWRERFAGLKTLLKEIDP